MFLEQLWNVYEIRKVMKWFAGVSLDCNFWKISLAIFFSIIFVGFRLKRTKSIYDSYNAEVAAVQISSIKLENVSDTYSEFNTIKFDLRDEHDKYILYSTSTAWICKDWVLLH